MKKRFLTVLTVVGISLLAGCATEGAAEPTAVPTQELQEEVGVTDVPEPTATPTQAVVSTAEPTATVAPQETPTPEPTATPTQAVVPTAEPTATVAPQETLTPEPTATTTPEPTTTPTPEPTATPTPEPTATPTPTPEPTQAPWSATIDEVSYQLNEDGKSYSVAGYWGWTEKFTILAECNGLPVTGIMDSAFDYSYFEEVSLPNSITSIGSTSFEAFGTRKIQYNGTMAEWIAIDKKDTWELSSAEIVCTDGTLLPEEALADGIIYRMSYDRDCYYVTGIENNELETVTIPAEYNGLAVKVAGAYIGGGNLKEVVLSEGITTIGTRAFSRSLETIVLPKSIVTIEQSAFGGSDSVIQYNGTKADWNAINKADTKYYFYGYEGTIVCTDGTLSSISVVDGIVYRLKEDGTGYMVEGIEEGSELEKVVLQAECNGLPVTAIGEHAFSYNETITEVVLPEGISTIGFYAFADCGKLGKITIPKSVTEIDDNAFMEWWGGIDYTTIIESITYAGTMEEWVELSKNVQIDNRYEAVCSDGTYIKELDMHFSLNADETSYCLTYTGEVAGGVVIVPAEYNGLPVTAIGVATMEDYAGEEIDSMIMGWNSERHIREVQIPATVTKISKYALQGPSVGTVRYDGTMEEWKAFGEISLWNAYNDGIIDIICTDGTIAHEGSFLN